MTTRDARVHYVICTHNNIDIIGDTLRAVAAQGQEQSRCTIVDGCSVDGTPDHVRTEFPWVEVIEKVADSGPADSRNIGLSHSDSEFVVLLDSDVRLEADWTTRQLALMTRSPATGACGGKLVYEDEPDVLDVAYGELNRIGIAWDEGRGKPANTYNDEKGVLWLSTSALMLRRQAVRDVGDFDAIMFAYHEDVDYGWRANLAGWKVTYNPLARARHLGHATLGATFISPRVTYLLWRNRLRSLLVNYQWRNLLRFGTLHLLATLHALVTRPGRGQILRALGWNLRHLPSTLARRRFAQARRRLPDSALLPLQSTSWRGPGVDT